VQETNKGWVQMQVNILLLQANGAGSVLSFLMLHCHFQGVNPWKGRLLLLESVSSVLEQGLLQDDKKIKNVSTMKECISTMARKHRNRKLLPMLKNGKVASNDILIRLHESKKRFYNLWL